MDARQSQLRQVRQARKLTLKVRWQRFVIRSQDRFEDFIKNRLALLGMIIMFFVLFAAFTAPVIQMHDPLQQNISNRLRTPDREHILGTDQFGRDIWARIVHGARVSMLVGIIAVGIGVIVGTPIGAGRSSCLGSLPFQSR